MNGTTLEKTGYSELLSEYRELDERLSSFRRLWNYQARKDLDYAKKHHKSKGKQPDFPQWWYRDVARWRELKKILNKQF